MLAHGSHLAMSLSKLDENRNKIEHGGTLSEITRMIPWHRTFSSLLFWLTDQLNPFPLIAVVTIQYEDNTIQYNLVQKLKPSSKT